MPGNDRQGAWASLMTLVVLGGLGGWGLWKATAPLATDRPTGRNAGSLRESMGRANARLWQDPLPAVRRSYEHALSSRPVAPADAAAAGRPEERLRAETQADLRRAIERELGSGLVIMPFRTSSDPTPESQENRVNYRYALVSALASEKYVPRDRSHVGWFVTGAERAEDEAVPVGYEWWDPTDTSMRPVLLMWLPSDLLRERAQVRDLRAVLEPLLPDGALASERVLVRYLTTGGSNALIGLVKEDLDAIEPTMSHLPLLSAAMGVVLTPQILWPQLEVYDCFATISDTELFSRLFPDGSPGPLNQTYSNLWEAVHGSRARGRTLELNSGARVHRTIGTDEELVKAIVAELGRRGIHPARNGDHIALVHEWDTAYGRALPETFRRVYLEQELRQSAEDVASVTDDVGAAIPSFTFLRGVDGRVSGEESPAGSEARRASSGEKESGLMSVLDVRAASERPLGQSQLDYLRRLVETLQSEDRETRRRGGRIAAIGVLASDTYDKQPIIQALRAGFPDAQYFTLDLHALLTHPNSYETMRNLLIASHFDLRLGDALQGTTPPFRYSYQTSLYRTAKLAVRDSHESGSGAGASHDPLDAPPQARLYEIGRSGHFDITPEDPGESAGLYPETHQRRALVAIGSGLLGTWPSWLVAIVAVAAAIFTIAVWMPSGWWSRAQTSGLLPVREGTVRGVAAIGAIACLLLLVFAAPAPALLLGGGSIALFGLHHWETSWRSRCGSALACERHGWASLFTPQHFAGMLTLVVLGGTIASFLWISTRPGQEPFVILEGISTWPSDVIRLVVCVLAVWFLYLARMGMARAVACLAGELGLPTIEETIATEGSRVPRRGAVARLLDWFRTRTIVGFDIESGTDTEVDGGLAWRRYLDRSRGRDALARTAILLVIGAIPVLCLFNLWGWPEVPSRGVLSRTISTTVLWTALVLTIAVCFHVWDATRLCRRFVQAIAYRPSRWPKAVVARVEERIALNLDDDAANAWIDIHVIATLTEAVGRAIWFPFTLLLLLVVAQHSVFDHWEINPAAVAAFIVASGVAFLSALTLRSAAEEARREELTHLRRRLMALQGDPSPAAPEPVPVREDQVGDQVGDRVGDHVGDLVEEIAGAEHATGAARSAAPATAIRVEPFDRPTASGMQVDRRSLRDVLKMLITEIEHERRGSFSPFTQNPAMQAVLLPFSGLGILQLIEQFAMMG